MMPGSVTSVFSEDKDFEAALREEGCLTLLVTSRGAFRARLTQVALHRLRLLAAEEYLPRIALVDVPADLVLVVLPYGNGPPPIWGGIGIRTSDVMALGAGQRLHTRTDGPSRWGSIWVPVAELVRYGSALTGAVFAVPSAARWLLLRPAMRRHLRQLHSAVIGAVESRSQAFIGAEAAHGLGQQLIEALVESLSKGSALEVMAATHQHQDLAVRFEALLETQPERSLRMAEICAALGVSAPGLRICCEEQLGMSPIEYLRRRRMQLVHRALRNGDADAPSISAVARHYGFRGLGRFAANYRALFGELPSATLRRAPGREMTRLTFHGRRSRV
jgi:AraC family transcriptional regulator, ethanolamine operon transcriptional activator